MPSVRLPRQHELRAVISLDGLTSPSLTGVGFMRFRNEFFASNDHTQSYLTAPDELQEYSLRLSAWPRPLFRVYHFHEICWQLLLGQISALSDLPLDVESIAARLFGVLHELAWRAVSCVGGRPRHAFCGTMSFCLQRQGPEDDLDRTNVDVNSDSYPDAPQMASPITTLASLPAIMYARHESDVFASLPISIAWHLIERLPSLDLCSLRLASRAIAALSSPSNLPQSFWRSRFAADREMGFAYLGDEIKPPALGLDWRRLYANIQYALDDKTKPTYYRYRMWHCVLSITETLIPLLRSDFRPIPSDEVLSNLSAQGYTLGQMTRSRLRDMQTAWYKPGVQINGMDHIIFEPWESNMSLIEIRVSFIKIHETWFVSGLRIMERHDSGKTEVSRAGFIVPSTEQVLRTTTPARLSAICVASASQGIVGLSFLYQSGSANVLSAGLVANLPYGTGVATLRPLKDGVLAGLAIGFDSCKAVSVQLVERHQGVVAAPESSADIPLPLWHPCEPSNPGVTPVPPPLDESSLEPGYLLDMNFGGADGSRLPSLVRIVACFGIHELQAIRMFHFFYADGSSTRDNDSQSSSPGVCQPGPELSLAIDGPGGERITEIRRSKGMVRWVEMFTNRGRSLLFRAYPRKGSKMRVDDCFGSVPVLSMGVGVVGIVGKVPVGRLLRDGVTMESLSAYGLPAATVKLQEAAGEQFLGAPSSALPTTVLGCPRASLTRRAHNSCITAVKLANIYRIRVSSGVPGGHRHANHVSGLCFEFCNSPIPVYVGQWFNEVARLELGSSERIMGFTFWENHYVSPQLRHLEDPPTIVTIAGVGIQTTRRGPGEFEVCLMDKAELETFSIAESCPGSLALSWSFSATTDLIQYMNQTVGEPDSWERAGGDARLEGNDEPV